MPPESVHNPYTAGCIDCNGCHLKNENEYFFDKDKERIFDPTQNPRYANKLGLPSLLLFANPILGVTHLHAGPDFPGHNEDTGECIDANTIVMEVGARQMNGKTTSARWFGDKSPFNRQGIAYDKAVESMDAQVLSSTCVGMNSLKDIQKLFPGVQKAIIITSSDTLIEGVQNLFKWTKNGFPDTMPEGPVKYRFQILRDHLQNMDATGLDVKFWKVAPEHINHATFQAECALLDHFEVPPSANGGICTCGNCMALKQKAELEFARDGHACRKDDHGIQLALKYGNFKKGQMIPLTNNADVTVNIPMRINAKGFVFCSDGTAKHAK